MTKITTETFIVAALWISIAISVKQNLSFEVRFVFGIISAAAITFFLVRNKKDYTLGLLLLFLFFSTFDVVRYSSSFVAFIGPISIVPFILMVTLIVIRRKEILNLRDKWLEVEPEEISKASLNKVALFKREFQSYSSEQLIQNVNNFKLVDEARVASQQLLQEREIINHHNTPN